jgi:DNA-binding response OmpR family regulator
MSAANILILDDEFLIAELLGELLTLSGHAVTICTRPSEALEHLSSDHYDVILSDFCMPQMNGRQFYEAAREVSPDIAGKVIFLTGDLLSEETESWTLQIGARCLAKPCKLQTVQSTVQDVLNRACARA